MQKISIKQDGKDVTIELQSVKGKHCQQGWEKLSQLQKATEGTEADAAIMYRNWRDSLASELSGLSLAELDELDIDERIKITSVIDAKLTADLGFTRR